MISNRSPTPGMTGISARHLLGVPNRVLNFRSGALRPGRRQDKITLDTGVACDPHARSRLWDDALKSILLQDELIRFFQTSVGYSSTGDNSLDRWFLCPGKGRNWKGTLAHPARAGWLRVGVARVCLRPETGSRPVCASRLTRPTHTRRCSRT
jgi:hypothetical protein